MPNMSKSRTDPFKSSPFMKKQCVMCSRHPASSNVNFIAIRPKISVQFARKPCIIRKFQAAYGANLDER